MEEVIRTLSAYISSGPDWPYALAQLYKGSSHTPLPKDKHLGILPWGKGGGELLSVDQLVQSLPAPFHWATSSLFCRFEQGGQTSYYHSTTNKHPYMRIDIPPPPLEESEHTASPVDEAYHIPKANSPETPPKARVSMAAEVNDLLTQAMEDMASHESECSPIGKVIIMEAVTSPPQKSEASPQPVDMSSQASMEEEASLEGLFANISPITAYSSRSDSPPADPTELQTDANRAADHMICLRRSTDLKRQSDLGVRSTAVSE